MEETFWKQLLEICNTNKQLSSTKIRSTQFSQNQPEEPYQIIREKKTQTATKYTIGCYTRQ